MTAVILFFLVSGSGPCHFDELTMLFPFDGMAPKMNPDDPDYRLSVQMVKSWTHFAKHGYPIGLENLGWPHVRSSALEYLKISNQRICMRRLPSWERFNLWKSLPLRKKDLS